MKSTVKREHVAPVALIDENQRVLGGASPLAMAVVRGPNPDGSVSTISSGEAVGTAVRAQGLVLMGVRMPAVWTAAGLGFLWAPDAETEPSAAEFAEVYDAQGAPVEVTPEAGKYIDVVKEITLPSGWIKVWSHSAGTGVVQDADRALLLVFG